MTDANRDIVVGQRQGLTADREKSTLASRGLAALECLKKNTIDFISPEEIEQWYQEALKCEEEQDYKTAVTWCRKAADQGHARAQHSLGFYYVNGKGVKQDYVQAVYWYRKAAEQGYAYAQFDLGLCYDYGKVVGWNFEQAAYWYQKAADQGIAGAQRNLGLLYYERRNRSHEQARQNYEQAVYWLRKAVDQGDAGAQFHLGLWYLNRIIPLANECWAEILFKKAPPINGGIHEISKIKAFYWIKKSAEQGYLFGQRELGSCYYEGIGVTEDHYQAFFWYKKAADRGDSVSQAMLGDMCLLGHGSDIDIPSAIIWYKKAAQEDAESCTKLGVLYLKTEAVKNNQSMAIKYFLRAIAIGSSCAAHISLGECFYNGIGVEKNQIKAAEHFWCAGKMMGEGNYDKGGWHFSKEEYKSEEYWFHKAAQLGNAWAMYDLGICYDYEDDEQASYWYQKAAAQGCTTEYTLLDYEEEHEL